MDHDGGAKARLVGEYAPLHALLNGQLHAVAHDAAAGGPEGESALEDRGKYRWHHFDVHDQNGNGANHINQHHKGHDFLRDGGDALQAAHDDQSAQNQQYNAADPCRHAEHRLHIARNGVDLSHIADAEGCQEAEQREGRRQNCADLLAALFRAKAVPQIVHGAAAPLALLVFPPVIDAQHILGVVGHHAEEGNDPHPEHRAGAAH